MKGTYSYIQVFSLNGGYVENIFYKFVHCISKPAKFLLEKDNFTVDFILDNPYLGKNLYSITYSK